MKIIVLKFGGASFTGSADFAKRAKLIKSWSDKGYRVLVVVSAMHKVTNELLALAKEVHPNPPPREQDMLISVGERMSMSLLAMALDRQCLSVVSFTGSQSGVITCSSHFSAHILNVKPTRVIQALEEGRVVIVAGFQGVSEQKEITTLGRGGSDTSAVALAIALDAEAVYFYKDVAGVFPSDPKLLKTKPFTHLNYDQALEIARKGAKVLHERCLLLAKNNGMKLFVLSFNIESFEGTEIRDSRYKKPSDPVYEKSLEALCSS